MQNQVKSIFEDHLGGSWRHGDSIPNPNWLRETAGDTGNDKIEAISTQDVSTERHYFDQRSFRILGIERKDRSPDI